MIALASANIYPALSPGETATSKGAVKGTDGEPGSGAYALNEKGESAYPAKRYINLDKQDLREKIWSHTNLALKEIRAGRKFQS